MMENNNTHENLELENLSLNAETSEPKVEDNFALELEPFEQKEQEDKLWQARTGLNFDSLCGAIETIVFMSEKPITLQKIKSYIDEDLPLRVLHESINRLQAEYEQAHHGIRLMEVAEGYQFRTKALYSKYVQDIFKVNSIMLTPSALEVLAIIAYKQPVSKTEIERIRGVDSTHLVRALMDKRLVKISGRSEEELGRPTLYTTTSEFLEVFNLASISSLPGEFELAEMAANNIGAISDIKEIVSGGHKPNFNQDETQEIEDLANLIKNIMADTEFTKLLNLEDKKRLAHEGDLVKSAFDLLEEQVDKDMVVKQMKQAMASDTLTMGPEARIVDLENEDGLINAPQVDSEIVSTLEFEKNELEEALDEAFSKLEFENHLSDEGELSFSDEDFNFDDVEENEDEEEDFDQEEDTEERDDLSLSEFEINETIINQAKDLDLDLTFLKEEGGLDEKKIEE